MKNLFTLFTIIFCFTLNITSLNAQTHFSVSMNGGTTYNSGVSNERFAGFSWSGLGNHVFDNTNSNGINIVITNYDEATSGAEIYIRFSRVGFGTAPLGWGSDNSSDLATLSASDFTAGEATVSVNLPVGTLPIAQTTDYVDGYRWALQVVGDNDPEGYVNYVSDVQEQVLNTDDYHDFTTKDSFYSAKKDAIILNKQSVGDFSIFNIHGQIVMKGKLLNQINVSTLKSGFYIFKTENATLKFIK